MLPSIIIPTSITASHQAALIVSYQYKSVLLGLGSDVGIIIEGSIILIFVDKNVKVQANLTWPCIIFFPSLVCLLFVWALNIFFQVKID